LDFTPQVIASCAVLHNIAKRFKLPPPAAVDGEEEAALDNEEIAERPAELNQRNKTAGLSFRDRFARDNFT
jgi:hypothetical protein